MQSSEKLKYKVFICKQCKKRRRIYKLGHIKRGIESYWVYACSKGHGWENLIVRAEHITKALEDVFVNRVKGLFDRDDTFYRSINKK